MVLKEENLDMFRFDLCSLSANGNRQTVSKNSTALGSVDNVCTRVGLKSTEGREEEKNVVVELDLTKERRVVADHCSRCPDFSADPHLNSRALNAWLFLALLI
ncbi:unnamed protein product [Heligmosomoides polygyrus]|uniref:Uncharacterized protein n=1 Tax=Heligmosomoides polygyrus TaxID=6339 RepID=A0A183FHB2_HELPZ|nr:unnamed protein product [Heligmosomoides polygyrus]